MAPNGTAAGAFSIADIAATARMWLLPGLPFDLSAFPRTAAMLTTVAARPAFVAARG